MRLVPTEPISLAEDFRRDIEEIIMAVLDPYKSQVRPANQKSICYIWPIMRIKYFAALTNQL